VSKEQIETNNAMLRNVVEPIVRSAANFQHINILQGTKVYGVHLHPIPIPAREHAQHGSSGSSRTGRRSWSWFSIENGISDSQRTSAVGRMLGQMSSTRLRART